MLVVIFLFQIPEVIKDRMNHYEKNEYEEQIAADLNKENAFLATKETAEKTGRYVVFIGEKDGSVGQLVNDWCAYTKRYVEWYQSVSDYQPQKGLTPEAVLLEAGALEGKDDTEKLIGLADAGNHLIFCNLPEVTTLQDDKKLQELLGISQIVRKEVKTEGIRLLEGFLLGGQKDYLQDEEQENQQELQDLQLEMPWYRVSSGTRTYMMGLLAQQPSGGGNSTETEEEGELENEELPAILWRNNWNGAMIFAVNGGYLESNAGLGFLSAIMTELKQYDIYPVINAQNLVVLNFPDLADENSEEMMKRYSQKLKAVYRDIVWPGLVSVAQQNSLKLTLMISPQMDYADEIEPEEDTLIYYMKLFQEQRAETGLSGVYQEEENLEVKLGTDAAFLKQAVPAYAILSFYQGNMTQEEVTEALETEMLKKVQTVFTDYQANQPMVSYWNDTVLKQSGITDGYTHTFSDNLKMNSIETALGYSTIQVDVNPVAYPDSDEQSWEKLSKKFASNTSTYWKNYSCFAKTTLAESDTRVRRFLALDYTQERVEDEIHIKIQQFDEQACFILRTHGEELVSAEGAVYTKIEEDAYLIEAGQENVVLEVRKEARRKYY